MALSDNMRGALIMALAMASFTANDAIIKVLTSHLNLGQIIFVRGVITFTIAYFVARHLGALRPLKLLLQPMVLLRCAFEVIAALMYLTALKSIDLANATAILQSLPLAVTLGAALFLGETVGWRRWTAIVVGFAGVLIILRPGPEGFTTAALMVAGSVFITAGRDLVTRRISANLPSLSVTVLTTFVNAVIGGLLIVPLGGWQPMDWELSGAILAASLLVLIGYQSIISAMRTGEISFVAPFRYTSLLWAFLIGIFIFQERPDTWTYVGATIVIGSGLYTFYRESRRKTAIARKAVQPAD
jgi:drug/metabolite transporter (DMT)-like permease